MSGDGRQGAGTAALGAVLRMAYVGAGLVAAAAAAVGAAVAKEDSRTRRRERLGLWAGHREAAGQWIWIQAASVGEAEIAVALARSMAVRLPDVRFVVSSMTAAGAARVGREEGIESRYFPIDFPPW